MKYDFPLSIEAALHRLATKYAMPARMWRDGIHSFLELYGHRPPDSLDHMLAFVSLAYSMMADGVRAQFRRDLDRLSRKFSSLSDGC
jgi:hypothetical protein